MHGVMSAHHALTRFPATLRRAVRRERDVDDEFHATLADELGAGPRRQAMPRLNVGGPSRFRVTERARRSAVSSL